MYVIFMKQIYSSNWLVVEKYDIIKYFHLVLDQNKSIISPLSMQHYWQTFRNKDDFFMGKRILLQVTKLPS